MEQHTLVEETIIFLKKEKKEKQKTSRLENRIFFSLSLILHFLHPNNSILQLDEKYTEIPSAKVHHKLDSLLVHPSNPTSKCLLNVSCAVVTKTIISVLRCIWEKVTQTNSETKKCKIYFSC